MGEIVTTGFGRRRLFVVLERDELSRLVSAFRATRKVRALESPTVSECNVLTAACARHQAEQAAWEMVYAGELMVDLAADGLSVEFYPPDPTAESLVLGGDQ